MEVAVRVDVRERSALAGRKLGSLEVALGVVVAGAVGVEAGDSCLPTDDVTHGLQRRGGGLGALVVADHGHAPGVLVEGTHVRALRAAVHAACVALVDVAVLVHQCVVADVAPAQLDGVVLPDAAHDAGCLGFGVVVGAGGVVHGGGGGGFRVVRRAAATGAPLRAGDHLGHAPGVGVRDGLDAALGCAGAAVQEDCLNVVGGGGRG